MYVFSDFENAVTQAWINIFWFCRNFLVATTLFFQKHRTYFDISTVETTDRAIMYTFLTDFSFQPPKIHNRDYKIPETAPEKTKIQWDNKLVRNLISTDLLKVYSWTNFLFSSIILRGYHNVWVDVDWLWNGTNILKMPKIVQKWLEFVMTVA